MSSRDRKLIAVIGASGQQGGGVVRAAQNAEGLPLGVQLASDLGHDLQLLALGEVLHRQPDKSPSC